MPETELTSTVAARLAALAAADPTGCALLGWVDEQPVRVDWARLDRCTRARADALRELVGPRGMVALPVANEPGSVLDILACLRAGITFVPVNARMPVPERDAVLRRCARRYGRPVFVVRPTSAGWVSADVHCGPASATATFDQGASAGADRAPAYALLTGGSSGVPKLVPVAEPAAHHPNRYPNPLLRRAGFRDGQRHLVVAPLHHAAAFSCFLEGVLAGVCTMLLPAFHPPRLWQVVADEAVEWMLLTPTHMRAALDVAVPRSATASLRAVLHTAAPCDPLLKRRWIDLLGPTRLFEMYGSTEGTGVTLIRGDEWLERPGSVGRGVWTRIQILDSALGQVGVGVEGEVFMRTTTARTARRDRPGGPVGQSPGAAYRRRVRGNRRPRPARRRRLPLPGRPLRRPGHHRR